MKDFKQIDACDVIMHLAAGKIVYACILQSDRFNEKLTDLRTWKIGDLIGLIKEENTAFFEKVEA